MVQWLNHFCCNKSTETKTGLKCHSCRNLNELFQMKKQTFFVQFSFSFSPTDQSVIRKTAPRLLNIAQTSECGESEALKSLKLRGASACYFRQRDSGQKSEVWLLASCDRMSVSDVQRLHFWTVSVVVLLHACTNQPHRGERWTQLDVSRL